MSDAPRPARSKSQCVEHCTDLLHITYMVFTESRVAARLSAGVTIGKLGVFACTDQGFLGRMHSITVLL
jgi:hypothetical protein